MDSTQPPRLLSSQAACRSPPPDGASPTEEESPYPYIRIGRQPPDSPHPPASPRSPAFDMWGLHSLPPVAPTHSAHQHAPQARHETAPSTPPPGWHYSQEHQQHQQYEKQDTPATMPSSLDMPLIDGPISSLRNVQQGDGAAAAAVPWYMPGHPANFSDASGNGSDTVYPAVYKRGRRRCGLAMLDWNKLDASAKVARRALYNAVGGNPDLPKFSAQVAAYHASMKAEKEDAITDDDDDKNETNKRCSWESDEDNYYTVDVTKKWRTLVPRPRPPISDACMASLCLTAASGFSKAVEVEKTCVELSNAARDGAAWKVKLIPGRAPPMFFKQFWPSREMPVSREKAKTLTKMELLQLAADGSASSRLVGRRNIKRLVIVGDCDLTDFRWPPGLEKLTLTGLGRSLANVEFPPSLAVLALEDFHNAPIDHIRWPAGLRALELSDQYNLGVEMLAWPPQLERLKFGSSFNQAIADVEWPSGLHVLEFGDKFDQPIDGVVWPPDLRELHFSGGAFNQAVDTSPLPRALEVLKLGDGFDQMLTSVVWPKGLETLELSGSYGLLLDDVVWPASLMHLTVPDSCCGEAGKCPSACNVYFASHFQDTLEAENMMSQFLWTPSVNGAFGMRWEHPHGVAGGADDMLDPYMQYFCGL